MISNITFTGRETMLVDAMALATKKVDPEVERFVSAGSILPLPKEVKDLNPFPPLLEKAGKVFEILA